MAAEIIDTEHGLQKLCDRLKTESVIAVDTEFLWERTYYPILGLVQVAVPDGTAWLVDPIRIENLDAFGEILSESRIVKVLHDPLQDLRILAMSMETSPKSIFDTREGAGFTGRSGIASLQSVIEDFMGVHLEKEETRSDWTRRPLSSGQLLYAADDVVYLPEVRNRILAACQDDQVRSWLQEEFSRYDDSALYLETPVEEMAAGRVKMRGLTVRTEKLLREVLVWREENARRTNHTRRYLMQDEVVQGLVENPPWRLADLLARRGMPRRLPERELRRLMETIEQCMAMPDQPLPRPVVFDRVLLKQASDRVLAAIETAAKARGIDPVIVSSRRDVNAWLTASDADRAKSPLVTGWRGVLLADDLAQLAVPAESLLKGV